MLNPHGNFNFGIIEGCISQVHGDDDNNDKLCNFSSVIFEERTVTDGINSKIYFLIEAALCDGSSLPSICVPSDKFDSLRWISEYGSLAMVYPIKQVKHLLPLAIRVISGVVPKKTVVSHTGWTESTNGLGHTYLTNGSAIGTDMDAAVYEVSIEDPRLSKISINPAGDHEALVQSVQSCLALAQMNPSKVILPLLGATYLAPLQGMVPLDLSVFLYGATGSFKSQLTMLCQSHYGREFHDNLPGNWTSTENALEIMAFVAKDALFVIDDFAYLRNDKSSFGYKDLEKKAERIFRGQGNTAGRQRMFQNALARSFFSRAMIMTSGETLPRGDSLLARLFVVQLNKGDIDSNELTEMQQYAKDGIFENAMAGYIKWLATNYDSLKDFIPAQFEKMRAQFGELRAIHSRTPDNTAKLFIGLGMFMYYAKSISAITDAEASMFMDHAKAVFLELGYNQNQVFYFDDAVDFFFDQVIEAMTDGAGHFNFINPNEFHSFERKEFIGWSNVNGDWQKNGFCMGWINGNNLYLLPATSYEIAHNKTKSKGFNLETKGRLWKRLHERGIVMSSDPDRIGTRKFVNGIHHRVLHLDFSECFKDTFRRRGEGAENGQENNIAPEMLPHGNEDGWDSHVGSTGTDDFYTDI